MVSSYNLDRYIFMVEIFNYWVEWIDNKNLDIYYMFSIRLERNIEEYDMVIVFKKVIYFIDEFKIIYNKEVISMCYL